MSDKDEQADEDLAKELDGFADDLIVEALAHGHSYAKAAEITMKSAKTVGRRMQDPEFRERVRLRRREIREGVLGQIAALSYDSMRVMRAGLESELWSVRFAVAKTLIGWTLNNRDTADDDSQILNLTERVRRLQQ